MLEMLNLLESVENSNSFSSKILTALLILVISYLFYSSLSFPIIVVVVVFWLFYNYYGKENVHSSEKKFIDNKLKDFEDFYFINNNPQLSKLAFNNYPLTKLDNDKFVEIFSNIDDFFYLKYRVEKGFRKIQYDNFQYKYQHIMKLIGTLYQTDGQGSYHIYIDSLMATTDRILKESLIDIQQKIGGASSYPLYPQNFGI